MNLIYVAIFILIFNLPFGYWRSNVKKFSSQWFLSVHIPVPFIILLRIYSGIGWAFITYPILVGAFFLGQLSGSILQNISKKHNTIHQTSCLVWDLVKITENIFHN